MTHFLTVEKEDQIERLIQDGVINESISIWGNEIVRLTGVRVIKGSLSIACSSFRSFGDLQEVQGGLFISCYSGLPRIHSLENIKRVGESLDARCIRLTDIGQLQYVGGDCKLNGSSISSLSLLSYVGGDLLLPLSFKYRLSNCLSGVQIIGKTFYCKSSRIITPQKVDDLVEYRGRIPEPVFDMSGEIPKEESVKTFCLFIRESFDKGIYYDLSYNHAYIYWLEYTLYEEFLQHKNYGLLTRQYETIVDYYGYERVIFYKDWYLHKARVSTVELQSERKYIEAAPYISFAYELRWYENLMKRPLMNADHGIGICRKRGITQFGKEHLEEIKPIFEQLIKDFERKKKNSFLDVFFTGELPFKDLGTGQYEPKYYRKFYRDKKKYERYLQNDPVNYFPWGENRSLFQHRVVEHAVSEALSVLLRQAEDLFREQLGINPIEEGAPRRETELFAKLISDFPGEKIVMHGRPDWLHNQHIDIYFEEYSFGIEYQGLQHYKPIEYFGGEEGFISAQKRDQNKIELCKEHNCPLLFVDESSDYLTIVHWVQNQIHDAVNQ